MLLSQAKFNAFPLAFSVTESPVHTVWSVPAFTVGKSFTVIWKVSLVKQPKLLVPVK